MSRFVIQYYFKTLATLTRKIDRQNRQLPTWRVMQSNVAIALNDAIRNIDNCDIPCGLNMIIELQANSEQEAISVSQNHCEMLINLVAYTTLTFCDSGKIISVIKFDENKLPQLRCYFYSIEEQDVFIGSPVLIDGDEFERVYETYNKNQYQKRLMRTLSWLRKGINEEHPIDEFSSYWIGLEVIDNLLREHLKLQIECPEQWDGVKYIYENMLNYPNFGKVKKVRNALFHGFHELSPDFVNEINTHIEPIRRTLITSVGEILGLEKKITNSITTKEIRKVSLKPLTVLEGELEGLPENFEELVENYPKLKLEKHNIKCEFDSEGDLKVTGEQNIRFICTPNAKLHTKAGELWGSKDPGVKNTSIKVRKM